jgi:hypothetical protein
MYVYYVQINDDDDDDDEKISGLIFEAGNSK